MTSQEVWNVKLLICKGFSQIEVARAIGVSSAQISRICLGDAHRNIEWPNPEVGERLMREKRTREGELSGWSPVGVPEAVVTQDIMDRKEVKGPKPLAIASEVIEGAENDAITQARAKAEVRAKIKKEIVRRVALLEEEDEREFKEEIAKPSEGRPDQNDPKKMPTAWEAKFLLWEEVLERAGGNSIVEVLTDKNHENIEEGKEDEDVEVTRRAVGIIFYSLPEEEWERGQAVQMIASVVRQLKQSSKES